MENYRSFRSSEDRKIRASKSLDCLVGKKFHQSVEKSALTHTKSAFFPKIVSFPNELCSLVEPHSTRNRLSGTLSSFRRTTTSIAPELLYPNTDPPKNKGRFLAPLKIVKMATENMLLPEVKSRNNWFDDQKVTRTNFKSVFTITDSELPKLSPT